MRRCPDTILYCGQVTPLTEVVCDLQCSRMTDDEIFRWLERKLQIGQFTPKDAR